MKFKLALSTATALGLLMGGAMAGSNNTAYTDQDGSSNSMFIEQNAGTGGNDVGLDGAPILQKGNSNTFNETQSIGGGFSRGNNDIEAAKQLGNSNTFGSNYSNNAGDNLIENVLQYGNENYISISRNNQRSGFIGTIVQGNDESESAGGNKNFLAITQSTNYLPNSQPPFTAGNSVLVVRQIGSNNGRSATNAQNGGTRISQSGNGNLIQESIIEGSNNNANGSLWNTEVHRINQKGLNNGDVSSIARTTGSGGNYIHVDQDGTANQFNLQQGVDVDSTGNQITAGQLGSGNTVKGIQEGSYNYIYSSQIGSNNVLDVLQRQNDNSATVLVTGDNNGGGTLTGVAGTLLTRLGNGYDMLQTGAYTSLSSGQIIQDGLNNTATLTVTNSNGNQFAFLQLGDNNEITGTVSGTGSNSATHIQVGSNNVSSFNQSGGSNSMAVAQ